MENPTSITGQILSLHEQGYDKKEILLEMKQRPGQGKLSQRRVNTVLQRETSRSADSRRLFEMHEMLVEILSHLREMRSARQQRDAAIRMRGIERKLIGSSLLGKAV